MTGGSPLCNNLLGDSFVMNKMRRRNAPDGPGFSLAYRIIYDNETGLFSAYSPAQPLIYGQGKSLDAAVDNLETHLNRLALRPDRFNVEIEFDERYKNEIELRAKLSIVV
jgi:hypothetical protein